MNSSKITDSLDALTLTHTQSPTPPHAIPPPLKSALRNNSRSGSGGSGLGLQRGSSGNGSGSRGSDLPVRLRRGSSGLITRFSKDFDSGFDNNSYIDDNSSTMVSSNHSGNNNHNSTSSSSSLIKHSINNSNETSTAFNTKRRYIRPKTEHQTLKHCYSYNNPNTLSRLNYQDKDKDNGFFEKSGKTKKSNTSMNADTFDIEGRVTKPHRRGADGGDWRGRYVNANANKSSSPSPLRSSPLRSPTNRHHGSGGCDGDDDGWEYTRGASITLHPTDSSYVLSTNNFTHLPKVNLPNIEVEEIPVRVINAIYKGDIDALLTWISNRRNRSTIDVNGNGNGNNNNVCDWRDMATVDGDPVLHISCKSKHTHIASYLLKNGCDKNQVNANGESPLYTAVNSKVTSTITMLLSSPYNVDPNVASSAGITPVNLASANGDVEICKLLVRSGADVSLPDGSGITPFFTAAAQGYMPVFEFLLSLSGAGGGGVDVNLCTNHGVTPLDIASHRGLLPIVKTLVKMGAREDVVNRQGYTPFHYAVEGGRVDVMEYFTSSRKSASTSSIDVDVDVNACNYAGMTVLHTAVKFNRLAAVVCLINTPGFNTGANVKRRDKYGTTPLDIALSSGFHEIARVLESLGGERGEVMNEYNEYI